MNTIEMIQEAAKNPGAVYETITPMRRRREFMVADSSFCYFKHFDCNNELITETGSTGAFSGNFALDEEWRVKRQPVPWQQAIKAWVKGKGFEIKLESKIFTQLSDRPLGCFQNTGTCFYREMFTEGQWFILD